MADYCYPKKETDSKEQGQQIYQQDQPEVLACIPDEQNRLGNAEIQRQMSIYEDPLGYLETQLLPESNSPQNTGMDTGGKHNSEEVQEFLKNPAKQNYMKDNGISEEDWATFENMCNSAGGEVNTHWLEPLGPRNSCEDKDGRNPLIHRSDQNELEYLKTIEKQTERIKEALKEDSNSEDVDDYVRLPTPSFDGTPREKFIKDVEHIDTLKSNPLSAVPHIMNPDGCIEIDEDTLDCDIERTKRHARLMETAWSVTSNGLKVSGNTGKKSETQKANEHINKNAPRGKLPNPRRQQTPSKKSKAKIRKKMQRKSRRQNRKK